MTPLQTRIVSALKSAPDGLSPVEIGAITGDDPRAIYASMSGMRRAQRRHWIAAPQYQRPSRWSRWMLTYKGALEAERSSRLIFNP